MTIAELLNITGAQIARVPGNAHGYQGLYVTDKQLHVQPIRNRQPNDLEILRFLPHATRPGLTTREWNTLARVLRRLQKEGVL